MRDYKTEQQLRELATAISQRITIRTYKNGNSDDNTRPTKTLDENGYSHGKYTIADLLENAMKEYVKNVPEGTK